MNDIKKLLSENPTIIATSDNDLPNISIASDVVLIDEKTILISHNEMIKTIENIKQNQNIALLCLDKNYVGVRIFGKAEYYTSGNFFNKVVELFKNEKTDPKGAIVVKIKEVKEIK